MKSENPPDFIDTFRRFIAADDFPCVGAKAAVQREGIAFYQAGDIENPAHDRALAAQLQAFVARPAADELFVSFVAGFPDSPLMDETEFEAALWARLQNMHDIDAHFFNWDSKVSTDPQSPEFGMCFGGRAFFIVGLHPQSSRPARRFNMPVLVFNLHSQFEQLRAEGRYQRMKDVILQRDMKLSGTPNPMLAAHGEGSGTRQYSGRAVGTEWQCPFRNAAEKGHNAE